MTIRVEKTGNEIRVESPYTPDFVRAVPARSTISRRSSVNVVVQFPSIAEGLGLRDEPDAPGEARTARSNGEKAKMEVLGDAASEPRLDQAIREED